MDIKHFITDVTNWSFGVHGPGQNTMRILNHMRKELDEVQDNPQDIYEWADVIILALNGAARQGFSPDDIVEALYAKLVKNKSRKWPDYRTHPEDQPLEALD